MEGEDGEGGEDALLREVSLPGPWRRGVDYFRIDGSVKPEVQLAGAAARTPCSRRCLEDFFANGVAPVS